MHNSKKQHIFAASNFIELNQGTCVPYFYAQMSEIIKNRVIQLFNEVNDNPELFVVDVQIEMNAEEKKISLLLDGDKGVSIKNLLRYFMLFSQFYSDSN